MICKHDVDSKLNCIKCQKEKKLKKEHRENFEKVMKGVDKYAEKLKW